MVLRACFVGLCLLSTVGCHGVALRRTAQPHAWGPKTIPKYKPLSQLTPTHSLAQIDDAILALQGERGVRGARGARGWRGWRPAPTSRRASMQRLGQIGGWAVPQLIERMRHRDREARRAAAVAFACIWARGDPAHVRPSMVKAKIHPDFTHQAVVALSGALSDVDDQVRMSAAFALGLIGPDASPAIALLAETSMDPQDKVAKQAIIALGRIGPKALSEEQVLNEYIKPPGDILGEELVELFKDDQNKRLRYYVAMALMALHSDDEFWIPFTRGLSEGGVPGGDHRFAEWPGYVTPRIIRELRDSSDWKVRRASAMALGEVAFTRPSDARRALRDAQKDPDPRVREAVKQALQQTITRDRQF